jgi:hypothetical protein
LRTWTLCWTTTRSSASAPARSSSWLMYDENLLFLWLLS